MSIDVQNLSDDPIVLKAMIATLQAENAKISATLRVHDQLVQALRLRIAKLQKLAFGKSSEKIEREIEQLELALEDLLVAVAEGDDDLIDEGLDEPTELRPCSRTLGYFTPVRERGSKWDNSDGSTQTIIRQGQLSDCMSLERRKAALPRSSESRVHS
jgi:hypothetical protein